MGGSARRLTVGARLAPAAGSSGNKWIYNVKFSAPGSYVLRAEAFTGNTFHFENITFNVTQ